MELLSKKDFDFNPVKEKLINGDIFKLVNDKPKVVHSTIKKLKHISGVMVLNGNKSYGKFKNKMLYRCVPDDKRLPEFVVPYKPQLKFKKKMVNRYITFRFLHWNNKHPMGQIQENIGEVNKLSNFYEYQMYCKSLYASIANMKEKAKKMLRIHNEEWYIDKIMNDNENIEDRTGWDNIVSIDSKGSKDLDDALSYSKINEDEYLISIYISNVSFWFDILDLWDSFTNRISTIYLPDRKRPMLPTILSDNISSLIENKRRFAFTCDIIVDANTFLVKSKSFKNCLIKVDKNYHHKTDELNNNEYMNNFKFITKKMNQKKRYIDSIGNSSDLIAYYMVLMNYFCAIEMKKYKNGIYRFTNLNQDYVAPEKAPKDIKKFLKIWHSMGGQYCKFNNVKEHDMLQLESYLHITSPNRRLVDMINMILFQDMLDLIKINEKSNNFCNRWINDESIEYINTTMRSIRKVQSDCSILSKCSMDETLKTRTLEGYIFDKLLRNDKLYQYIIYLPELKMTNRLTSTKDLDNLQMYNFKIYIFMDEIRLKQKIRLLLID
jgi:exoribonuclease R